MTRKQQPTRSRGLMTWLATHILTAMVVYVLALLVALGEPVRAAAATAAPPPVEESPSTTSSEPQQFDPNLVQICSYLEDKCEPWAPPPLLNLDQQVFFASPAQRDSLRELEKQAVANVISRHSLTDADQIAVQTWGRYDAIAELYALLVQAILAPSRNTHQQNAVAWLEGIMKQKAIAAADNAGREYVKWAGLNMAAYETVLRSNPTNEQLRNFLSDHPQFDASCNYVPPTPYSSDYSVADHPICQSQGLSCQGASFGLGCIVPAPSYDQFVKYGQAGASFSFLNSAQFVRTAQKIATGFTMAAFVGSGVALSVLTSVAVGTTVASGVVEATGAVIGNAIFPFTATLGTAAAVLGVIAVILAAIVIAVVVGIQVVESDELPRELADLITGARTTSPDATKLTNTTEGATTLFSIVAGASLPEPDFRACDNSNPGLPPGITVTAGILVYVGAPCLNPSAIPPPASNDVQFLLQAQGSTTTTLSPTISYHDAATGSARTARLSKNWFITEANGSSAQTLRIEYTDWSGRTRNAWLLGKPSAGYKFVTFAPTTDASGIDPDTCVDSGNCSIGDLEFVGTDGQNYSAKARGPSVAVGNATFSPLKPAEGSPQSFNANGFSFTDAVGAVTYEWRFQRGGCIFGTGGCMRPDPSGAPQLVPSYSDPVSGSSVTHTWTLAGTFLVELTAIDSRGIRGSKAFPVTVENVPPTLLVHGECILDPAGVPIFFCNPRTRNLGEPVRMSGTFDDVGTGTYNRLTIHWGDGAVDSKCISPPGLGVCFNVIVVGQPDPLQLGTLNDSYTFDGSHTYASPGSYYGTVTVHDPLGGSKSEPFVVTIKGHPQSIDFAAIPAQTYGGAPIAISATGGASGQAVTFSVTGAASVCALSNTGGNTTLSLLKAGTCTITANQPGGGDYEAAGAVTQSFPINKVPLTVTASSPTITYGTAVPPITPSYSAFAGSESAASLDTQPTCFAAPSGGAAGIYVSNCSGAVDPNYDFTYVGGTLTIDKAPSTLALTAAPAVAVKGQPVAFTATVGSTSAGATNPGGTVDFMDGAAPIGGCAGLPVNPATNTATCTVSSLTVGSHSVRAAYGGDTNFNGSTTAAPVAVTVNRAATTTTVSTPAATSVTGQAVTFIAGVAVTAPGAGTPAGTVTFLDGTTTLGTSQLGVVNGNVQASFNTSGLVLGRHSITARYAGNGDFTTSTSTALIHDVNTNLSGYALLPSGAVDLSGVNLRNAWLVGVSLEGARLIGGNFMGATFMNTVLAGADLSDGNFSGVNFTGADLTGANFTRSNLRGAKGLNTATLTNAVWSNTLCPNGRNSDSTGGTCAGQW